MRQGRSALKFLGVGVVASLALVSCGANDTEGLALAKPAATTVKFDFYHQPLPNIPMPNDVATRFDSGSATGRRINASLLAHTEWERRTRRLINGLDGWGTMQAITVPFSGALDVDSIVRGHRDTHYDFDNDVVYLIDIDPASPEFGSLHHVDMGEGNFPVSLKDRDLYWKHDPRSETVSLVFEEIDEDLNQNGVLDPGEDTDADGILDKPNYYPGASPAWDDLGARADAHMTFYERETNTLIVRPLLPLRERTTYAVVVTRRILDASGEPVGSPFRWINHTSQSADLAPLASVLPDGLAMDDVAFAFSYTTQSVQSPLHVVRDGLYGHGAQAHLAETSTDVTLAPMRDRDFFPGLVHDKIFRGEDWAELLPLLGGTLLGGTPNSKSEKAIIDAVRYIDFFASGSFQSPQLRQHIDGEGKLLDPNLQVWPEDLERITAPKRDEEVYFTLTVPRKEVSRRGEGKPAPLIVLTHGHTSNRAEMLITSIWFAKYGFASLSIDAPGHGLSGDAAELSAVKRVLASVGLGAAADALLKGRAVDLNNDGTPDSGPNFFTSYLFHTRDNIRQYCLDLMQTIRIIKSFDGVKTWSDVDGDGVLDLAGDVDGDGVIDIGKDASLQMFGGSMGGMTVMLMAALEPHVEAIAPFVGGGVLADVGFRSNHSVAPGGFFLQGVMGPFWVGTLQEDGTMLLEHIVESLAKRKVLGLGSIEGVRPGDVMMVENLTQGSRGCGLVQSGGGVRATAEVDRGDEVRLSFHRDAVVLPGLDCELAGAAREVASLETFLAKVSFEGQDYESGASLQSLGHGLGRLRASPNLRRLRELTQLVLDPADPINFARQVQLEPYTYEATQETTGAHVLSTSLVGDMAVPTASGIAWARAAGLVDFKNDDPRYGKPINQVLIDTHTLEGVSTHDRYLNQEGVGVLLDVEHFSEGMPDKWGTAYPRLDEPLRIGTGFVDPLGGASGVLFPLSLETGEHVFSPPGGMLDEAIKACEWDCFNGDDPECTCEDVSSYDVGFFIVNTLGRWLQSGGDTIRYDRCASQNDCDDIPPIPVTRADGERL